MKDGSTLRLPVHETGLVLTRHVNERIIIDNRIVITVLAVRGGIARLLISAPREMSIDREEIWLKKNDCE